MTPEDQLVPANAVINVPNVNTDQVVEIPSVNEERAEEEQDPLASANLEIDWNADWIAEWNIHFAAFIAEFDRNINWLEVFTYCIEHPIWLLEEIRHESQDAELNMPAPEENLPGQSGMFEGNAVVPQRITKRRNATDSPLEGGDDDGEEEEPSTSSKKARKD